MERRQLVPARKGEAVNDNELLNLSVDVPSVLTAAEVAELMRVNVETVYRLAKKGQIPGCRRVGRSLRFCARTVLLWLAQGNG